MRSGHFDIVVASIDREQHVVNLIVGGRPVTAICAPQDNAEVYENVKDILIGAVANSSRSKNTVKSRKFDRNMEM